MIRHLNSALLATAFGFGVANAENDCQALSQTVALEVSSNESQLLQVVSKHASEAPGCVCEVVRAAINASKADPVKVAAIVEAAATAVPEHLRLISQCAIATAPDAAANVQAVLAKLDPNSGDSAAGTESSKSPAGDAAPEAWNPLDFPHDSKTTVGPLPGMDGGNIVLRPGIIFNTPPGINLNLDFDIEPPVVTPLNP